MLCDTHKLRKSEVDSREGRDLRQFEQDSKGNKRAQAGATGYASWRWGLNSYCHRILEREHVKHSWIIKC